MPTSILTTGKWKILSLDEQRELFRRYQEKGDRRAFDALVMSQYGLAYSMAYKFSAKLQIPVEDLVQEAMIGVMEAVKRFDVSRNVKLTTYVVWWVRAYLYKYVPNNAGPVKFGASVRERKMLSTARNAKDHLTEHGEVASVENIADQAGISASDLHIAYHRVFRRDVPLDRPLFSDSDARELVTLKDVIRDDGPSPEKQAVKSEARRLIRGQLASIWPTLKPRERAIIENRLMRGQDALTLADMGKRCGISRERVRQLELKLKRKLRDLLKDPRE